MSKEEKDAFKMVAKRLRALTNVKDGWCRVEDEHKNGVRLYLDTWVTPVVEALGKDPSERTSTDKSLLKFAARDLYQRMVYERNNPGIHQKP